MFHFDKKNANHMNFLFELKLKMFDEQKFLIIQPDALKLISERAFTDVSHLYRSSHLQQLKNILDDPEASNNDHLVALSMLKNANVSSSGILPMCQDTGTAIVNGYKGQNVFTGFDDGKFISEGIFKSYQNNNLRFSQLAPISMFEENNTNKPDPTKNVGILFFSANFSILARSTSSFG